MTPETKTTHAIYQMNIERYVYSQPLWRIILARYFDKHKVTKQEYDAWFYKMPTSKPTLTNPDKTTEV